MKLIIAGSRTFKNIDADTINRFIKLFGLHPNEVVSGGATGVDASGEWYAKSKRLPIKTFKADWDEFGKAAGPIRNKEMAQYADALLLIWDGTSRGSMSMKTEMLALGKPVHELIVRSYEPEYPDAA